MREQEIGRYSYLVAHGLSASYDIIPALLELDMQNYALFGYALFPAELVEDDEAMESYIDGLRRDYNTRINAEIWRENTRLYDDITPLVRAAVCRIAMIRAHGMLGDPEGAYMSVYDYHRKLFRNEVEMLDELAFEPKKVLKVVPAYGRTPRTAAEVMELYNAERDFRIVRPNTGQYVNKEDKPDNVILRVSYANDTRSLLIF